MEILRLSITKSPAVFIALVILSEAKDPLPIAENGKLDSAIKHVLITEY